jgi:transcriptional regulator GlxA family with amidase domain
MNVKTIAIVATEGVQLLDVAGPADVFAEANVQAGGDEYRIRVLGVEQRGIRTSAGIRIEADHILGDDLGGAVDTLLIAGAPDLHRRARDEAVLSRVRDLASGTRRFGSVCTGAVLLGQAGLLAGRRVTTHWAIADAFAALCPDATLEVDAIHLRDGPVWTAAGVTAGLDLALALVTEDLGADIARRVAAQLVMYFRRPGGQLQHRRTTDEATLGRSTLQAVQRWVEAHPAERHSVDDLAGYAGMSPRHFARLFRAEIGVTPAAWVARARVAAARAMLEEGVATKVAAARAGFADPDVFRRVFARHMGVSPADYRKRAAGPG